MTNPRTEQGAMVALIRMDRDGNIQFGGEMIDIQRLIHELIGRYGEHYGDDDGQE